MEVGVAYRDTGGGDLVDIVSMYIITDSHLRRQCGLELIDEYATSEFISTSSFGPQFTLETIRDCMKVRMGSPSIVRTPVDISSGGSKIPAGKGSDGANEGSVDLDKAEFYMFVRRQNGTIRPAQLLHRQTRFREVQSLPPNITRGDGPEAFLYMYTGPSVEETVAEWELTQSKIQGHGGGRGGRSGVHGMGSDNPSERAMSSSPSPEIPMPLDPLDVILVFFKYFDVCTGAVSYVTSLKVPSNTRFRELIPVLNKGMGFAPNTRLNLYEHIKPRMNDRIKNIAERMVNFDIGDGDIIIFERVAPETRGNSAAFNGKYFPHSVQFSEVAKCFPSQRPMLPVAPPARAPSNDIVEYLASMYGQEQFSDVEFDINGTRIPAHKIVIARTPYFHAMMTAGMREARENVIKVDAPLSAFEVVLQFLYTGSTGNMNPEDAEDVLVLSEMYELTVLGDLVSGYVRDQFIRVSNAVQYLICAHRHNFPELKKDCMAYILDHYGEVGSQDYFASGFGGQFPELFKEIVAAVAGRLECKRDVAGRGNAPAPAPA